MARSVMHTITITSFNGEEKWDFTLRKDYLSSFNASFMLLLSEKKNDQIIQLLYLSKIVIDYITVKKIDIGIEDFYDFLFKFNSTLSYYEKKFPKKTAAIKGKIDSYSVDINYKVETSDNIMEYDHDMINIFCPNVFQYSNPLIPEFFEIFKEQLYVRKKDEDDCEYMCRLNAFLVYLNEYYNRFPDDSILELISNTRTKIESNYRQDPDFAYYVENNTIFTISKNDYIATNLELFIEYLFLDILSRNDITMLDRIASLLSVKNSINSEKFYSLCIDKIADVIKNNDFSDIYTCFMNLRNKHSNRFIFETFIKKYILLSHIYDDFKPLFEKEGETR